MNSGVGSCVICIQLDFEDLNKSVTRDAKTIYNVLISNWSQQLISSLQMDRRRCSLPLLLIFLMKGSNGWTELLTTHGHCDPVVKGHKKIYPLLHSLVNEGPKHLRYPSYKRLMGIIGGFKIPLLLRQQWR